MLAMVIVLVLIIIGASVWLIVATAVRGNGHTTKQQPSSSSSASSPAVTPVPEMRTTPVSVGGAFTVAIPNGWTARVSTSQTFMTIQVGTPNAIEALRYNENTPASIDYSGIPSWSGLTEHFYVRQITQQSQAFDPKAHANVTTETFAFKDGTTGTKYSVTKDAAEAKKWGGLLKDTGWHGRVYSYAKGGTIIEAHLAYYPSTKIDHATFETIARSIKP